MGYCSCTLMRPSAFLCMSLVLLVCLLPETCHAGKKVIPPVKHLFGVGIGYQKVVHYKPVLVISKSRRVKHRPSGWSWSGGGSGRGRGGTAYTPVVLEHHVHKQHGKSGHSIPHPPPHHHRQKRKRMHHHHHHSHHIQSSRGWGWRRPHRSHRKGHGSGDAGIYHSPPDNHHYRHGSSYSSSNSEESDRYAHHPRHIHDNSHHRHEISDHPTSSHHHHDHGDVWGGGAVGGGGGLVYPSHSFNYYGSPYSSLDDMEDDHGGYESEIREQWKKGVPTTPPPFSSTTMTPAPTRESSLYPFAGPPQSDTSVTNIQRDFLKTHMKNFHQFQEYQLSTTKEPRSGPQEEMNQFAPHMLRPPGPHFSTTDPQSSETEERGNANYYDYNSEEIRPGGLENYDEDYSGGGNNNELNRKMVALPQRSPQNTKILTTVQPTFANNAMMMSSSNKIPQVITAMPKIDTNFKPSPRVDEVGSGNSFNEPAGFFPTSNKFKVFK